MTKTIDIDQQNISLSELVTLALAGTEVILAEGSEPRVRLVPVENIASSRRVAGPDRGAMIADAGFDSPLPDSFWIGAE